MTKVTIAGCGIVGATIAYELSQVVGLEITVVEAQSTPIQPDLSVYASATGAALGVLMGAISKKEKGNNLRMRFFSIQYYNRLIPELERLTGLTVPFNRQGILMLQFSEDELSVWKRLVAIRQQQGWRLEILGVDRLQAEFPFLQVDRISTGVYSPDDRQVNPTVLTHALVQVAEQRGVTFQFNTTVTGMKGDRVETSAGAIETNYLIIASGIGTTSLTQALGQSIEIRPVLGQAIHVRLPQPLGDSLPVITGNDVHLVPLGESDYWIGATVEFPTELGEVLPPSSELFDVVMREAIAFCPPLAEAQMIRQWSGLRPRPQGRPAPIIERLPGCDNVFLATGHYRNGVLLAPATANAVRQVIEAVLRSSA
jgi:glycine/D-amino acid oxidase-like deaminating enzyme